MAGKAKHDYDDLLKRSIVILSKTEISSLNDLADALGVNYNTLQAGFRKQFKITTIEQLRNGTAEGRGAVSAPVC